MAVNTGTAVAIVDGYELQPGDSIDYTTLRPEVIWDSPIMIDLSNTGSKIRITRLRYKEVG